MRRPSKTKGRIGSAKLDGKNGRSSTEWGLLAAEIQRNLPIVGQEPSNGYHSERVCQTATFDGRVDEKSDKHKSLVNPRQSQTLGISRVDSMHSHNET